MALKLFNIRWIRIGSQSDWKIMYSIVLQKFSTNIKIKLIRVLFAQTFGPSGQIKLVLLLLFSYRDIQWKILKHDISNSLWNIYSHFTNKYFGCFICINIDFVVLATHQTKHVKVRTIMSESSQAKAILQYLKLNG